MKFTPYYPPTLGKSVLFLKTRAFLGGLRSWLHVLPARAYIMKMGDYKIASQQSVWVNDPEWVKKILIEQPDCFPKHRFVHDVLSPLIGNSIFATNGELWQKHRRIVDQGFEQARLSHVFPTMLSAVDAMHRRLDGVADGRAWEAEKEMSHVTADVIFRTIISADLQQEPFDKIYKAFMQYQREAQKFTQCQAFGIPTFPFARKLKPHASVIRAEIEKVVSLRLQAVRNNEPGLPEDVLAVMIRAHDPETGYRMTDVDLVNEICFLFLAGHETTASTLGWGLYLIASDPEVQARIREEVQTAWAEGNTDFSSIKKLQFTADVVRETLRLYPPVGLLSREAACPVNIRGRDVKPGAMVNVLPWLVHRHRDYWERPDEFDPDRFQTEAGRQSTKIAYLPFSRGRRTCLGAGFATQEAILILASMVQHYTITTADRPPPCPMGRMTIRSDKGIWLTLRKR